MVRDLTKEEIEGIQEIVFNSPINNGYSPIRSLMGVNLDVEELKMGLKNIALKWN